MNRVSSYSKVVSSFVDQELTARGVAQVIAVLASPTATAGGTTDDAPTRRVASHFTSSERSIASALRDDMVTRSAASNAPPAESPAITFPNLGVVLGTANQEGIAGLQASDDVAAICGAPPISLIRPERTAAATLDSTTTWGLEFLGIAPLWDQGLTGKGIKIGHLDTGVDGRHPALKKAVGGFAFFELAMGQRRRPDPAPFDSGDHGTHTAGTIVGRPINGRRFGVAPGASLYAGVVLEGGNAVARVLGGLDWAIASRVKIISMSFGFSGWWEDFIPIVEILRSRGILPVIAVGNEGPGTSRSPGNYVTALSVGAIDNANRVADFSSSQQFNRADDTIVPDLVAPGVDVVSAAPNNSYQSMSGSSMATPHIAGLAALLWEAKPSATAAEIEQAIFDSCRRLGRMTPQRANRGVPEAGGAFTRLTGQRLRSTSRTAGRKTPPRSQAARTSRKRRGAKTRK